MQEEQFSLTRSAVYAALYASNLFFARHTSGYFDGPTDRVPLLHTWSLSVKEQLCLAWPPLLIGLGLISTRLGVAFRRTVLFALMAILAASFVWGRGASLGEGRTAQADFYLIFSRA